MPLSWNEIRDRAIAFSREWADETSEDAEAKSFLDAFFNVFGVPRRRVASFEKKVKKIDGKDGYIDLLWPGMILVEMKSRGKDLERAHQQAREYFPNLKDAELPRYILVSDFERFHLYDLEPDVREDMFKDQEKDFEFKLKDLHKNIRLFSALAGYDTQTYKEQDPTNIEAAELMGALHDELKAIGYTGHDLEVLLVRLLFCLFADDTGIFAATHPFERFIRERTHQDGSDLAARLSELFEVLNQDRPNRLKNLDQQLDDFPYVNGRLFAERIRTASFNRTMRDQLIACCEFDWSAISPAIFGALFQSIMDDKARRNLGAHYTSEKNILKLIKPLFLDELREEFEKVKRSPARLAEFHTKLRTLTFLDPACGCGNFLVITYRELRLLELDVLRSLQKSNQLDLDLSQIVRVDVDQFYGIELEEWPAQIAQVAMWLVDHQMNTMASLEFGQHFARIPLVASAKIVKDNALRIDWSSVVPKEKLSYIIGNPPFSGAHFMSESQREDVAVVFRGVESSGLLDLVAAWYIKAAHFIQGTRIACGFVSTNSITQGEQVGVLWQAMLNLGVSIAFAHRTFIWRNEASGLAAVHCVIIGFDLGFKQRKTIFDYHDARGDASSILAHNINPYLVDAPNVLLPRRSKPICDVPELRSGNKPVDDGNFLFTPSQKNEFLEQEPLASGHFKRWLGGEEFINAIERWCLWVGDCTPEQLKRMPLVLKRLDAVRKFRETSASAPTRKIADRPAHFHVEFIPRGRYLALPQVSSERRPIIPIAFLDDTVLCGDKLRVLDHATMYHFGVMTSTMHMAWMRTVTGRLKSDYQYSALIVYNNFPWPMNATEKQKQTIEQAAQAVLDARAEFPNASLADLYDPLTMPPKLLKAHQTLDKAVDAAYGKRTFDSEAARVAFLFEEYQKLVQPLMGVGKSKPTKSERRK